VGERLALVQTLERGVVNPDEDNLGRSGAALRPEEEIQRRSLVAGKVAQRRDQGDGRAGQDAQIQTQEEAPMGRTKCRDSKLRPGILA